MATILEFSGVKKSTTRFSNGGQFLASRSSAEIVIFPGIRIEREASAPLKKPKKSARRKARSTRRKTQK